LALVTVIVALLATIVSPWVQRARDRALVSAMKAELRTAVHAAELYHAEHFAWPASLDDLVDEGLYTPGGDVEYCYFVSIPAFSWREESLLLLVGHPGTTHVVYTVYPAWGQMWDFDTGKAGCGAFSG